MNFAELLESIDEETCERLRRALEIGKWPDGRALTREQKELCLQAVIAYDHRHADEAERVGYIDRGSKSEQFEARQDEQKLRWVDDAKPEEH